MLIDLLQQFVTARVREHPQIQEWFADWSPATDETQINIDPTGLEPGFESIDALRKNKPDFWTMPCGDRVNNIRIPRNAFTPKPSFRDWPVRGPIFDYWQYIGTSGWDWKNQKSKWVGFDFDSIIGHEDNKGLTAEQLEEIHNRALSLPYVTLRTSTSGNGYHVIVKLNPRPTTRTHTEHSQLAHYVLERMSRDCDYHFDAAIDCCGLILWQWKRGLNDYGLKRVS